MFRHDELGDLGRLVIVQNDQNSQLFFEVTGDDDDPATARRKEIFLPLAHEIGRMMESIFGKGSGSTKPYETPDQIQSFRGERIECNKCGECVAFIIYASPNATPAMLEDHARQGFSMAKELNVPTWVISTKGQSTVGNMCVPRLSSLKFFPERDPIRSILGTDLDDLLCPLVEEHCKV